MSKSRKRRPSSKERVARFFKKHGHVGKSILNALDSVDPFELKSLGAPCDEYLVYAERFMKLWVQKRDLSLCTKEEMVLTLFRCFSPEQYLGIHTGMKISDIELNTGRTFKVLSAHPDITPVQIRHIAIHAWENRLTIVK